MSPGTEINGKAAVAAKRRDSATRGPACPYHFGNSVRISVHIHVDRNMGRVSDVMWTTTSVHNSVPRRGPSGYRRTPYWAFVRPQGSREPGATRTGRGDRGPVELLAGLLFGEVFMAQKKARQKMPGQQFPCTRVTPRGPCRPCRPPPQGPSGPGDPGEPTFPKWDPAPPQGGSRPRELQGPCGGPSSARWVLPLGESRAHRMCLAG